MDAVSPASLYIVVGAEDEGVAVDQVEVQKLNEAFRASQNSATSPTPRPTHWRLLPGCAIS